MKQVLLIQPECPLRLQLQQNLDEALNLTTIAQEEISEGIKWLSLVSDISLVIFYPQSLEHWKEFTGQWQQLALLPPLIVISNLDLGENQEQHFNYTHIDSELHWLFVVKIVADYFAIDLYQIADNLIDTYVPIASYDLFLFARAPFPIFEKSTDQHHRDSFKMLFSVGDECTEGQIRSLIKNGSQQLYLREDDLLPFLNLMIEHFDQKKHEQQLSLKQLIFSAKELHTQALAVLSSIGSGSTLSELVTQATSTIIEAWLKRFRLSRLLNMVMNSDGSYLFQHFSLTSILACEMELIRNGAIDQETIDKLTCASFLHDISISYNFHLTRLYDQKRLSQANLSHYDYLRVVEHAKRSAEVAKSLKMNDSVINIIVQHHGRADGIGFENNFPPTISPLTQILSIAEKFSFSLLEAQYFSSEGVSVKNIIDELDDSFQNTSGHQYVELLKKVFIREKKIENLHQQTNSLSA